jgi:hypothetical protein
VTGTAPQFYAPDLVDAIVVTQVDQEICTHSFSHILADEMHPAVIAHDIGHAIDEHLKYDLDRPRSYVPPHHQRPSNEILGDAALNVQVAVPR